MTTLNKIWTTVNVAADEDEPSLRCRRAGDRVEVEINARDDRDLMRFKAQDESGRIICERLVRTMPTKLSFEPPSEGRYSLQLEPVHRYSARSNRSRYAGVTQSNHAAATAVIVV